MVSGNNIRKARKKAGLTQEELARKCDCATNTIGRIERGELQPAQALKENIAEVLGLRLTIMEPEDQPSSTDPARPKDDLRTLLQLLGQMSPEDLGTVGPVIQALASLAPSGLGGRQKSPDPSGPQSDTHLPKDYDIVDVEQLPRHWIGQYLPIIGRLAAGKGFDTSEAEAYPAGVACRYLRYQDAPRNAFALAVEGQSMAPQFRHGDMVIVDPDQPAKSGACVILTDDGGGQRIARLKRLVVQGSSASLESLNPAYPTISLPAERVTACTIWRHLSLSNPQPAGSAGYRWS
jgi:SOS-response transcriptional repressor LexA